MSFTKSTLRNFLLFTFLTCLLGITHAQNASNNKKLTSIEDNIDWIFETGGHSVGFQMLSDEKSLYLCGEGASIIRLDPSTGMRVWEPINMETKEGFEKMSKNIAGHKDFIHFMDQDKDFIYANGMKRGFFKVAKETGEIIWATNANYDDDVLHSAQLSKDGKTVYTNPIKSPFAAINSSTGKALWETDLQSTILGYTIFDNKIYTQLQNGKMAVLDAANGNLLKDKQILNSFRSHCNPFVDEKSIVLSNSRGITIGISKKNHKQKWIDSTGKYSNIFELNNSLFAFSRMSLTKVDPATGKAIWSIEAGVGRLAKPAYFEGKIYLKTDRLFLIIDDKTGEIYSQIPLRGYTYTRPLVNKSGIYIAQRDKVIKLNWPGTPKKKRADLAINFQFDEIGGYAEGLFAVKQGDKWGFIDENGKTAVPFNFDEYENFKNGVAAVSIRDQWQIINKKGSLLSNSNYDKIELKDRHIKVSKNRKWGLLDYDLKPVAPIIHGSFTILSNNTLRITGGPAYYYGVNDFQGKTIIPTEYKNITESEGFYLCTRPDYASAYFNSKGERITEFDKMLTLLDSDGFHNGLAPLAKKPKGLSIIDTKMKVVIDSLNYLDHVHEHIYIAGKYSSKNPSVLEIGVFNMKEKKWIISKKDVEVIQYGYDNIWWYQFRLPSSKATDSYPAGDYYVVIDENEKKLMRFKRLDGISLDDGIIIQKFERKKAFLSMETNYQSKFIFEEIISVEKGKKILAFRNGFWELYSNTGKLLKNRLKSKNYPWAYKSPLLFPLQNSQGKWGYIHLDK